MVSLGPLKRQLFLVLGLQYRLNVYVYVVRIVPRESLYLCTARMIVYTDFSVGNGIGPETSAPERFAVSTIFSAD